MRTVGVIAEYNPFHLGHAYQLQKARKAAHADWVVVVMSGCFTQRGEAALLSPLDRACMALRCGADAVLLLPALWSIRDAEHFALGGVALLAGLGVDALSFGAETADPDRLWAVARLLESPDGALKTAMRPFLERGLPYPAALAQGLEAVQPGLGALLASPNNTLAVCYLRALLRLGSPMEAYPITRLGEYHETALGTGLPSATALRGAILRGDWRAAEAAMPENAFTVLRTAAEKRRLHWPEALDQALLYRLRAMTREDYRRLPDLSEGIERRLQNAASAAVSRETLLEAVKTRRYPYARLSRLCTHALLGLTDDLIHETPLPPAAWLLGLRASARPLMTRLHASGFPLLCKAADADREQGWFQLEVRAYDLWALGIGEPAGLAYRQGVAMVENRVPFS